MNNKMKILDLRTNEETHWDLSVKPVTTGKNEFKNRALAILG